MDSHPRLSWNKRLHNKFQNLPFPFVNLKFLETQPTDFHDFLTPTSFPGFRKGAWPHRDLEL